MHDSSTPPPSSTPHDDDVVMASLADDPSGTPGHPRRSRPGTRLVITVMVLLVLGPVLWRWIPKEIARWHAAGAMEKHMQGDSETAKRELETALQWDPESGAIYRQRADLLSDLGEYEQAVEDYSRAVELEPADPLNPIRRSVALQHLKRHGDAIRDWQTVERLVQGRGQMQEAIALNGLAYARALGKTDLDRALDEVNEALQLAGRDAALLDTRGYIQYLRGEYQTARNDLDLAVQSMETQLAAQAQSKDYADARRHQQDVEQMEQSTAVLRYHRALVLHELGEDELADQDLRRVRQLGHEPGDDLF